jgi:hypothetical protein
VHRGTRGIDDCSLDAHVGAVDRDGLRPLAGAVPNVRSAASPQKIPERLFAGEKRDVGATVAVEIGDRAARQQPFSDPAALERDVGLLDRIEDTRPIAAAEHDEDPAGRHAAAR